METNSPDHSASSSPLHTTQSKARIEQNHSKALNFIRMNSEDVERKTTEDREKEEAENPSDQDQRSSEPEGRASTFKKNILKVTRFRDSEDTSKIETDLSYEEFHYLPEEGENVDPANKHRNKVIRLARQKRDGQNIDELAHKILKEGYLKSYFKPSIVREQEMSEEKKLFNVKRITAKLHYHFAKEGTFIYKEGHVPMGYYMIIHGEVTLKQKHTKLLGGPSKNFKYLTSLSNTSGSPSHPYAERPSLPLSSLSKTVGTVVKKTLQNKSARMMINEARRSNILQYEDEVQRFKEGDSFGDFELSRGQNQREQTATAETDCHLLFLPTQDFNSIFREKQRKEQKQIAQFLQTSVPGIRQKVGNRLLSKGLLQYFQLVSFSKSAEIVKEGAPLRRLYIIIKGNCEITCRLDANESNPFYPRHFRDKSTKLTDLSHGSIFGEAGLFIPKKISTYSVRALSKDVVLFAIRYIHLHRHMELIVPFLQDFFIEREKFLYQRKKLMLGNQTEDQFNVTYQCSASAQRRIEDDYEVVLKKAVRGPLREIARTLDRKILASSEGARPPFIKPQLMKEANFYSPQPQTQQAAPLHYKDDMATMSPDEVREVIDLITPKGEHAMALQEISPNRVQRVKRDAEIFQKMQEERYNLMSAPGVRRTLSPKGDSRRITARTSQRAHRREASGLPEIGRKITKTEESPTSKNTVAGMGQPIGVEIAAHREVLQKERDGVGTQRKARQQLEQLRRSPHIRVMDRPPESKAIKPEELASFITSPNYHEKPLESSEVQPGPLNAGDSLSPPGTILPPRLDQPISPFINPTRFSAVTNQARQNSSKESRRGMTANQSLVVSGGGTSHGQRQHHSPSSALKSTSVPKGGGYTGQTWTKNAPWIQQTQVFKNGAQIILPSSDTGSLAPRIDQESHPQSQEVLSQHHRQNQRDVRPKNFINWTLQSLNQAQQQFEESQMDGYPQAHHRHSAYANRNVFPIRRTTKRSSTMTSKLVAAARHTSFINPSEIVNLVPEIQEAGLVVVQDPEQSVDTLDLASGPHELKSLLTTRHLVGKTKKKEKKKKH